MLVISGSLFTAGVEKSHLSSEFRTSVCLQQISDVLLKRIPLLQINLLKKLEPTCALCSVIAGSCFCLVSILWWGQRSGSGLCESLNMNILPIKITFSRAVKVRFSATRGRWRRSGVWFYPLYFYYSASKQNWRRNNKGFNSGRFY